MSEEMKNLNEQSEETVVETPETQVENVEPTVEFVKPQFIEKKPLDKKTLGIIAGAAAAVVVILGIILGVVLGGQAPQKDYTLVVVTDSAVNASNKVSNTVLVLVIDADDKIVAARFDCAEVTPSLVDGAIANVDSVITKVEKGDGYTGMAAGSWADQAKAFEDYLIGKTAAEVAAMDTADKTLIAGCTMSSSKATFKALVAKAFASTLKVEFKAAGDITVGAAISTKISGGKVSSDFAGVVLAGGKVAATMIDSCELKFTVTDGAIVAPATPAVSKNDQGEEYSGMPAGPWYKQAQAFANSFVGKTVDKLADLPASGVAGCTVYAGGYKATLIKAAGYAR